MLKVKKWTDQLGNYFANLDFSPAEGAGHLVHYEKPELTNEEIFGFFRALR